MHSVKPFTKYEADNTGCILGKYTPHTQHIIKCYDKGLQYTLKHALMRFEDRYYKMQPLAKYEGKTLADLKEFEKVKKLGEVLFAAWSKVLIFEPDIDPDKIHLTKIQRELLIEGRNRDYWIRLQQNRPKYFNKQRVKFIALQNQYSLLNTHAPIGDLIKKEWNELLKMGTFLQLR